MRLRRHPIRNKFDAHTGRHQMLLNFHNDSQVQSVDTNHFRGSHWLNCKQAADCKVAQKHTRDSRNKTRNSLQINKYIFLHLSMGNCLLRLNYVIILLHNFLKIKKNNFIDRIFNVEPIPSLSSSPVSISEIPCGNKITWSGCDSSIFILSNACNHSSDSKFDLN